MTIFLQLMELNAQKLNSLLFIPTQFNITINNQSYPIPAGIGIVPNNCIYWMHTHDDSGLIHIESPVKKEFTLGQFLDIWNRFNSSDTVVQNITNDNVNGTLLVYIKGTQMNNNTDYRNIETSKAQIKMSESQTSKYLNSLSIKQR